MYISPLIILPVPIKLTFNWLLHRPAPNWLDGRTKQLLTYTLIIKSQPNCNVHEPTFFLFIVRMKPPPEDTTC